MPMSTFCPRPVHTGDDVGLGGTHLEGRTVPVSGQAGDPTFALDDQVVARQGCVGPRSAVPRDRAVDEPRIDLARCFVAVPEALHQAGTEILDHDVGRNEHVMENLQSLLVLQVERHAALVAVYAHEVRALAANERGAIAARVVAVARPFDLHHVGAHVGQHHAAIRTG